VRKPDYQRVFWTIVAIHVVAGAYWVLTSAR
jgi:hypothetical protein